MKKVQKALSSSTVAGSAKPLKDSSEAIEVVDLDQEMTEASSAPAARAKPMVVDSAVASENATTTLSLDEVVARAKVTVAGTTASASATSAASTLASAEAAKLTMVGGAASVESFQMELERTANLAETALLESSLNQSALKMLQMDYNSDFKSDDDDMLMVGTWLQERASMNAFEILLPTDKREGK